MMHGIWPDDISTQALRALAWTALLTTGFAAQGQLAWASSPLEQARKARGEQLAQHLGQGWRVDASGCDLLLLAGGGHIQTRVPMQQVHPHFDSAQGASLRCAANAPCITRRIDNRANTPLSQLVLAPGASWQSTHAANLATQLQVLCALPAQATPQQISAAQAMNSPQVRAFIFTRREHLFGSIRGRIHDAMGFAANTCTITEPRQAGARAQIPLRQLQLRAPTREQTGLRINLECERHSPCITITGATPPKNTKVSWALKGTQAQQDAVMPTIVELKSLCTFDHQLPPVIH